MSTVYNTPGPLSIEEFERRSGWKTVEDEEASRAVYTDGVNYVHVDSFEISEGVTGLAFEIFSQLSGNNISALVEMFGLVSEHDEEFWDLPWNALEPVGPDDMEFDVVLYDEEGNDIQQYNHVSKDHIFDRMVELMADHGKPGMEVSATTMFSFEDFYPRGKDGTDEDHSGEKAQES